ncbi:MAG: tetratricopeptide repeat protein [Kofleriaceae bacterium]|nr:tetratricopeptide repeat protein [Kofleriaceae bacterium]
MARTLGALLLSVAIAACGGGNKGGNTTPTGGGKGSSSSDPASMNDTGDPNGPPGGGGGAAAGGGALGGGGAASGADNGEPGGPPPEAPVVFPNLDPDPQQAKVQVDQQLAIAKQALSQNPPDADGALRAAREALKIDASSLDAAAYVAFAYYHKKQYDTAELVLDELLKRPSAKQNANVYYVYGLVYEHTNRPEQAALAYKTSVDLNPNFTSALVNLGVFQLRNKQYGEAQTTFEKLTRQMNRTDAVTLTSLGSAYRGRSADYPPGSGDRSQFIMAAEAAYKRALSANPNYGPAYFNLGLLYLDADPFPSGGGSLDTLQRLNAAKSWLDQYKNMPGVDMKLYDERLKDVNKAIKREESRRKKASKTK